MTFICIRVKKRYQINYSFSLSLAMNRGLGLLGNMAYYALGGYTIFWPHKHSIA